MVKYSSYRTSKYAKKVTGKVIDAVAKEQKKKYKASVSDLVKVEQIVKKLVSGCNTPYYIVFGKECVARAKKHSGTTLLEEVRLLEIKWMLRGLDRMWLDHIKVALNIPLPSYCFTLDVSYLDGPDVLCVP